MTIYGERDGLQERAIYPVTIDTDGHITLPNTTGTLSSEIRNGVDTSDALLFSAAGFFDIKLQDSLTYVFADTGAQFNVKLDLGSNTLFAQVVSGQQAATLVVTGFDATTTDGDGGSVSTRAGQKDGTGTDGQWTLADANGNEQLTVETDGTLTLQDTLDANSQLISNLHPYAIKPSDESRTEDTTLTDDDDLVVAVVANATYWLHASISVEAASITPDMRFGLNAPTSTTLHVTYHASSGGSFRQFETIEAINTQYAVMQLAASTNNQISMTGTVQTAGTAGNVAFMWKQNTSSTDAVTVRQNSSLMLVRIA